MNGRVGHGTRMPGQEELPAGRTNLAEFAETLLALARVDRDIIVVTSDSRGSAQLAHFARELPAQLVEVGVAEQNLVGIAAGLASAAKKVFAVSPASFLTARALEQIKNDVAYSDRPVRLVGVSAGVSYGPLGSTHHSLHDLAALLAIHNIDIVAPADNFETREAVRASLRHPRPLYLRIGKRPMPHLHRAGARFEIGTAVELAAGRDVLFVATGEAVAPAYQAALDLGAGGISVGVLSMHAVKPLDVESLCRAASAARVVVTAEEHSVAGGLGEACAAVLAQRGIGRPIRIIGIPDVETITGSQQEIFDEYGLTPHALARIACDLMGSPRP